MPLQVGVDLQLDLGAEKRAISDAGSAGLTVNILGGDGAGIVASLIRLLMP